MNMVMNVIAVLLSLAMTLTGVGGEGQPAEAARNLVLHNITVSYNGEALRLGLALLRAYKAGNLEICTLPGKAVGADFAADELANAA